MMLLIAKLLGVIDNRLGWFFEGDIGRYQLSDNHVIQRFTLLSGLKTLKGSMGFKYTHHL